MGEMGHRIGMKKTMNYPFSWPLAWVLLLKVDSSCSLYYLFPLDGCGVVRSEVYVETFSVSLPAVLDRLTSSCKK